jgi:hypothetical protein
LKLKSILVSWVGSWLQDDFPLFSHNYFESDE